MSDEITTIIVSGFRVGMIGLKEVFQEAQKRNFDSEEELKQFLLDKSEEKNYVPDSKREDYAQAVLKAYKKFIGEKVEEDRTGFPIIRVLGPGCPACENLERDIRDLLAKLNLAAEVEHVRDVNEIAEYGMIRTPGLVINNELVINGRVPRPEKLAQLLQEKLVKNS